MLIHITPRFYLQYCDVQVSLIDIFIPEFDLLLAAEKEVTIRTPYSNKNYLVVCRKKGKKANNGILIETDLLINAFTVIARWSVNNQVSTHRIHYHIGDHDFDAVTDYMLLWRGFYNTDYKNRQNQEQEQWVPAYSQPRMIILPRDISTGEKGLQRESYSIYNTLNKQGIVQERVEYFSIPTVERERLLTPFWGNAQSRIPSISDIFITNIKDYQLTLKPTKFSGGIVATELSQWIKEVELEFEHPFDCPDYLDYFHLELLKEINNVEKYFFTNTNDLVKKATIISEKYCSLPEPDKQRIDNMLTQPLFTINYNNKSTSLE